MAKSNFNLSNFQQEVLNGAGLARTNRFEVLITPPIALSGLTTEAELVSLYVEQASMPLLNIFTRQLKIFGPTYQMPVTSEYGGEGMPILFNVDRNMNVKTFFEDWMHQIIHPTRFTVNYQHDYTTDILIRQLDEQENVTQEIKLIDAFPRNMNILELNNSSTNQTHRINILFSYRYWINTAAQRLDPVPIRRTVTTPQVPVVELPVVRQFNWQTGDLTNEQGSDLPPSA